MALPTTTAWNIKTFGVLSIAKFGALIGFVWGFLAGIVFLFSYIQGYITQGDLSLIQSGLYGLGLMALIGIVGGAVGGAVIAFLYNRVFGAKHGISVELEKR
jgi:hypothetical protein